MRLRPMKILQKIAYDIKLNKFNFFIILLLIVTLLCFLLHFFESFIFRYSLSLENRIISEVYSIEPIDVVYTWVNGSDPVFINNIKNYDKYYDPARFDDKNELKYSLRSLDKYAPWIRHIYIVTNGQIPHWINLENKRITIISHNELCTSKEIKTILPTFSSTTIETFLHKIPKLSKKFLYLNDDIFLNDYLYPDDLITDTNGVNIYTAWFVPDCAIECSWAFIGDGSCDQHCNIDECQYDGGDCIDDQYSHELNTNTNNNNFLDNNNSHNLNNYKINKINDIYLKYNFNNLTNLFVDIKKIEQKNFKQNEIDRKRNEKNNNIKIYRKQLKRKKFNDYLRKNLTNNNNVKNFVETFNDEQRKSLKMKIQKIDDYKLLELKNNNKINYLSSKDIFAKSLIYTNKIFNRIYGFKTRQVLAHVGFLLDCNIIDNMLIKFSNEFQLTKSHKFRNGNDMQFAFTYYHYLMSETKNNTINEIFYQFDTDQSGTWSDREIRTLLSRIYPLPLDWAAVRYFEELITNCSLLNGNKPDHNTYSTLVYERYEDSNIPRVTEHLVANCSELVKILMENFGVKPMYRYKINPKTGMQSNFKMLTSNITQVVDALDELRRTPKKFNCINDNLDPIYDDDNQLIKSLLEDFYLSFFPHKSQYELNDNYRNRFKFITEYYEWKYKKYFIKNFVYIICLVMLLVSMRLLCFKQKGKFARKFIAVNNI